MAHETAPGGHWPTDDPSAPHRHGFAAALYRRAAQAAAKVDHLGVRDCEVAPLCVNLT